MVIYPFGHGHGHITKNGKNPNYLLFSMLQYFIFLTFNMWLILKID
jgi:hypothetical protein